MTMDPKDPAEKDVWSEWLLERRYGSDPAHKPQVISMTEQIRDRVLDGAHVSSGMTLVDVGSGDGLVAFGAFERIGPTLRAVLVDVSQPLLAHAEQRAVELGVRDACTFVQTSAELLEGVANASADVVTTRAVLAYVADKEAAVRSFHRVLKPGGCVSMAEPIDRDGAVNLAAFSQGFALTGGRSYLARGSAAASLPGRAALVDRRSDRETSSDEFFREGPGDPF